MKWVYLSLAVLFETIGTSSLKASAGFTNLWPSILVVVAYVASFYFLSLTLDSIPVGVAYAIWSALGIALITAIGYFWFGQKLDWPAFLGLALIIAGVIVLNLFSKSTGIE